MTAGQAVAGTYSIAANGRGTTWITSPSTSSEIFYVISATKFALIRAVPGDTTALVTVFEK